MFRKQNCSGLSYTRYITMCDLLLWLSYVSLEVKLLLFTPLICYCMSNCLYQVSAMKQQVESESL